MDDDTYRIVQLPDIQHLVTLDGFSLNSYPVTNGRGVRKFGVGSYFVNVDWLNKNIHL